MRAHTHTLKVHIKCTIIMVITDGARIGVNKLHDWIKREERERRVGGEGETLS